MLIVWFVTLNVTQIFKDIATKIQKKKKETSYVNVGRILIWITRVRSVSITNGFIPENLQNPFFQTGYRPNRVRSDKPTEYVLCSRTSSSRNNRGSSQNTRTRRIFIELAVYIWYNNSLFLDIYINIPTTLCIPTQYGMSVFTRTILNCLPKNNNNTFVCICIIFKGS